MAGCREGGGCRRRVWAPRAVGWLKHYSMTHMYEVDLGGVLALRLASDIMYLQSRLLSFDCLPVAQPGWLLPQHPTCTLACTLQDASKVSAQCWCCEIQTMVERVDVAAPNLLLSVPRRRSALQCSTTVVWPQISVCAAPCGPTDALRVATVCQANSAP